MCRTGKKDEEPGEMKRCRVQKRQKHKERCCVPATTALYLHFTVNVYDQDDLCVYICIYVNIYTNTEYVYIYDVMVKPLDRPRITLDWCE